MYGNVASSFRAIAVKGSFASVTSAYSLAELSFSPIVNQHSFINEFQVAYIQISCS